MVTLPCHGRWWHRPLAQAAGHVLERLRSLRILGPGWPRSRSAGRDQNARVQDQGIGLRLRSLERGRDQSGRRPDQVLLTATPSS